MVHRLSAGGPVGGGFRTIDPAKPNVASRLRLRGHKRPGGVMDRSCASTSETPRAALWFPPMVPPARRGTDPERDEKFESGFLQR
jgi:hypothetical protein